jgi:predicted O-methyltransferase YrrM
LAHQIQNLEALNRYVSDLFATEDEVLRLAREEMEREGLPQIAVSASEGKLLQLLTTIIGARRILEIGTLGGYSAIWMARAMGRDGRLTSLEIDPHHAEVARRNVERAGLSGQVDIIVGPALESIGRMQGQEPFDLVFIDADKDGYVDYLNASMPLLREGGLLLADNTLPDAVVSPEATSGAKRFNAAAAARPDLMSTIVTTLRRNGLDGLFVGVKGTPAR